LKTINITQARQDLFNIVEDTINHSVPVQIQTKHGAVVLVSKEDWNAMQETLYLRSIFGFKESLDEIEKDTDGWISKDDIDWKNF